MKRKLAAQKRLDDARNLAAANGGICLTTAPLSEPKLFYQLMTNTGEC